MFPRSPVLGSVFPVCLSCLFSSGTDASSPEFDWTQSCQAPDYEQLGHELVFGPAAKRPALADSGETHAVRLVYFLPNDRTFNPDVVDSMKARIPGIRTFFRNQMQSNGKGAKTFEYETDDQGDPLVHRFDAPHSDPSYLRSYRMVGVGNVFRDLGATFDTSRNIFYIVVDHSTYNNLGWVNVAGFGARKPRYNTAQRFSDSRGRRPRRTTARNSHPTGRSSPPARDWERSCCGTCLSVQGRLPHRPRKPRPISTAMEGPILLTSSSLPTRTAAQTSNSTWMATAGWISLASSGLSTRSDRERSWMWSRKWIVTGGMQ